MSPPVMCWTRGHKTLASIKSKPLKWLANVGRRQGMRLQASNSADTTMLRYILSTSTVYRVHSVSQSFSQSVTPHSPKQHKSPM